MGTQSIATYRRRFAGVMWRDLQPMRVREGVVECLHPLPWLAASWAFAAWQLWPLAAGASFMLFLTALRLNHEAIHGNLGFRGKAHRWVLHGLSAMMLGSNTAVAFQHLRHHRYLGTPEDIEGACGRMTFWQVLREGPRFPLQMHADAWHRGGPVVRRRMTIDLAFNALMVSVALLTMAPFLLYHVGVMLIAQCLTGLFAVWITHHGCAEDEIARTQRSPLVNWLSYNMFLHFEHHLFPAVPVKRLGVLAARMAAAQPDLAASTKTVLGVLDRTVTLRRSAPAPRA